METQQGNIEVAQGMVGSTTVNLSAWTGYETKMLPELRR